MIDILYTVNLKCFKDLMEMLVAQHAKGSLLTKHDNLIPIIHPNLVHLVV